jgi:hypothetical protein
VRPDINCLWMWDKCPPKKLVINKYGNTSTANENEDEQHESGSEMLKCTAFAWGPDW